MREIKFRFWDIEQRQMWTQEDIIEFQQGEENAAYNIFSHMLGGDHWIPMQYTGLKGNSGKEIYEGDIFEISSLSSKIKSYYEVAFGLYDNNQSYEDEISGYGWYLKKINGKDFELRKIDDFYENCEVIGNIYEHKHLFGSSETKA